MPSQSAQRAIWAIELIRATTQIAIFASDDMTRADIIDGTGTIYKTAYLHFQLVISNAFYAVAASIDRD